MPFVAAVASTIALCGAGIAQAQLSVDELNGAVAENHGAVPDTDFTPHPRRSTEWTWAGGAHFDADGLTLDDVPEDSPTPYTVDLYGVAFANRSLGLAGGGACATDTPPAELETCVRTPAIYRYAQTRVSSGWEQVMAAPERGYVSSVAFIGSDRAIAVGGDGNYPRRELEVAADPSCVRAAVDGGVDPAQAKLRCEDEERRRIDAAGEEPDAAGMGRAWLYDPARYGDEAWHEVGVPEDMGGLTSVACSADGSGECIAGGLGQIWRWHGGAFRESWTSESPEADFAGAAGFRFRVRQVRFNALRSPTTSSEFELMDVVMTTAGCCTQSRAGSTPSVIVRGDGRWHDLGTASGGLGISPALVPGDSYYSLIVVANNIQVGFSVVAGFGGPRPPGGREVPARVSYMQGDAGTGITQSYANSIQMTDLVANLASVRPYRLAAGDGDSVGACTPQYCDPGGDKRIDWAVGELTDTGQAAALTTAPRFPYRQPIAEQCTSKPLACEVRDPDEFLESQQSQQIYSLDGYALNGYDAIGTGGTGWAVGDRGAIFHLGTQGTTPVAIDEKPAAVGPRRPTERFDAAEAGAPAPVGRPGQIAALGSQPTESLDEPRLVAAGSPDPDRPGTLAGQAVASIAMSRDGSEGWAVGAGTQGRGLGMTLYRFGEGRWQACDPVGIPGVAPPDEACAALAPLLRYRDATGAFALKSVVRVPLERDPDPTNDDRFEAVAIGTGYRENDKQPERPAVLRYSGGKWAIDADASLAMARYPRNLELEQLAFTAPDDGWIVGRDTAEEQNAELVLFHLDKEGWVDCRSDLPRCGEPASNRRLPLDNLAFSGVQDTTPLGIASAGSRVYLWGTKLGAQDNAQVNLRAGSPFYPFVIYRDSAAPCERAGDPGCWRAARGGIDPVGDGTTSEVPENRGTIFSFSVASLPGGGYEAWATGQFGPTGAVDDAADPGDAGLVGPEPSFVPALHFEPGGAVVPWSTDDATRDYLSRARSENELARSVMYGAGDGAGAVIAPGSRDNPPTGRPMLRFDAANQAWEVLPAPFLLDSRGNPVPSARGWIHALAPDGQGGFWVAVAQDDGATDFGKRPAISFYRYTSRAPRPVFEEVANPVRAQLTDAAGAPDGSLWVSARDGSVYRYDRALGWQRTAVPGWNPGRVATSPAAANAVAIGPGGEGLVVGQQGRIADVGVSGVRLNASAGAPLCARSAPPCGTGYDLTAAAVAEDGSALVGGARRALLWRPADGEFRGVAKPSMALTGTITGIAMPNPSEAFLTTDTGEVWAGVRSGGSWDWGSEPENVGPRGDLLTLDQTLNAEKPLALSDIALDADGRGFAVGERGVILERTGDPRRPWIRRDEGYMDNLTAVALAPDGDGALVGGEHGLVLTYDGARFEVAQAADSFNGFDTMGFGAESRIVGLAILPGYADGQVEAWALQQSPSAGRTPPGRILHHTNAPFEPLLDPTRLEPLPDTDPPTDALSFAAFGKSDCAPGRTGGNLPCSEMMGASMFNELVAAEVRDQVAERAAEPGGPDFAVFTGDAADRAGAGGRAGVPAHTVTPVERSVMHRRWRELIVDPLVEDGVPLWGAVGGQDLSGAASCSAATPGNCLGTGGVGTLFAQAQASGETGLNLGWRDALSEMPAPWGAGETAEAKGLVFEPVAGSHLAESPVEGAATHYAVDVHRNDETLARLIVLDSSLRSLSSSDPLQSELEPQIRWLAEMLCFRGTQPSCSRPAGTRAIVVSNTPTYSYGPGALTATAPDATQVESTLIEGRADVVLSGRLGWNGLYYATAPGLHWPCPGGSHPDTAAPPPDAGSVPRCDAASAGGGAAASADAALAGMSTRGGGGGARRGALPFVVSASAGGKFGPDGQRAGSAADGFWNGYSVVHLGLESGRVVVEQRPIFDWVGFEAGRHIVQPRGRLSLGAFGRGPTGMDSSARYDEISGHAITHRYDLLLSDPEKPWLPCSASDPGCVKLQASLAQGQLSGANRCAPHLCLPERVARIDRATGQVRAGDGRYPETAAVALLSVGELSATYPIVFEKSPAFVVKSRLLTPGVPQIATGTAPSQAPPPEPPPPPRVPQVNLPAIPAPPAIPSIDAAAPPEPQPPAPPAPPPPSQQPAALDLSVAPPGISISTPTALIQPPTPPVNPAPPGGARKEARQRQAAAQKGGADSSEEGGAEGAEPRGDTMADAPYSGGSAMTRHDAPSPARQDHAFTRWAPGRAEPSFSVLPRRTAATASQGALPAVGGLTLAALTLALGFTTLRPGSRRRSPEVPAPARAFGREHRR